MKTNNALYCMYLHVGVIVTHVTAGIQSNNLVVHSATELDCQLCNISRL